MTVIARFEVIPVRDGSMSTAIASALQALDRHPVSYRTTATDTIIEAETVEQVFAAVQAAHQAIPDDRVITSVQVDEDRRRAQSITDSVASVERELGHPPERQHPSRGRSSPQQPPQQPTGGRSPQPQAQAQRATSQVRARSDRGQLQSGQNQMQSDQGQLQSRQEQMHPGQARLQSGGQPTGPPQ